MSIGTVLVLNTQDTATHKWADFYPGSFSCVFTEDTEIAYLDIRDVNLELIDRILNIQSGIAYPIKINRKIQQLYFVPDALQTEKKLSISNITFDNVNILNKLDSAGLAVLYSKIVDAIQAADYALALTLSPDAALTAALQASNLTLAAQLADKLDLLSKSGTFILTDGTPADNVYRMLYIENGVLKGFTYDLRPDSLRFYRVLLKDRVIAYVIGNALRTVSTSLVGYTDLTPRLYGLSPNMGRMALNFGALSETLLPEVKKPLSGASYTEYVAPPIPFESNASLVERLSATAVTYFAANAKQRFGQLKELI